LSGQPDLEGRYGARRDAVFDRLVTAGVLPEAAERWVWAWEAEGRIKGLDRHAPRFWEDGLAWIAEQRAVWGMPPQRR
jgi:hypothetical protein